VPDLIDELELVIRAEILGCLEDDRSGEPVLKSFADLLIVFANWRARSPDERGC
jgi:hypothetical protein